MIVADYVPALGGTTTQTRLHAHEFLQRGWDVTVLTRRIAWGQGHEVVDGAHVRRLGPPGRSRLAKAPILLAMWWWLLLRRPRIAAVSVIMDPDFALCAWAAGMSGSTALTWVTRGDATRFLRGRKGRLRRWALRRSAQVVLTRDMAAEVEALTGRTAQVVAVPVDLDRFHAPDHSERADARASLELADNDQVLVSVGHLQARKGVLHLLEAVRDLRDEGVRLTLIVVGGPVESEDSTYVERLHRFLDHTSLEDAVRLVGPQRDVVPYLWAADLFCLASEREGMPNVLLEAMACALPCVAPASAGGVPILEEGAGYISPSNTAPDLADAIARLLSDPAARGRMGERARSRVTRDHGIGPIVDRYEAILGLPRRAHTNSSRTAS